MDTNVVGIPLNTVTAVDILAFAFPHAFLSVAIILAALSSPCFTSEVVAICFYLLFVFFTLLVLYKKVHPNRQ